ncbi:hypothetical protein [Cupriavidus sp. amp6]|uniref:hypothetical protein n=1 Tax=Cupriavidus sp. amp6 TaxID=388051 RepID=UPI000491961E|nr:hypothetical protein [Cupriavidus sp. amp6]
MAQLGRRGRQRRTRELVLGTLALLVVAAGLGVVGYNMKSRPNGLNPETMCPPDGPVGHYVLMVDKTDPLNFTQKQAFSVIIQELVEKRIPEGYLLSVFVLGEDFKETAAPLVELCNPGDGSDKSELTANLKRLKAQYRLKFMEPVLKQSESLISSQPAKWSPVFEMLQLVGINAYHKHDVKGERRLIIVSDMLHNTPQFTMYKGPVDYATFAATDYGKKAQPELRDVEVDLHYLMNSPQLQTKKNLKFWEDYFSKAGARIVAVRPLEG